MPSPDPAALAGMQWYAAPAKLNLFLHVVGRRDDGYHLLETLFTFLDHADQVGVRLRRDGAICRVTDLPGVPPEDDLCVRAARLLARHAAQAPGPGRAALADVPGADLAVHKVLPMGGGLGGGSSDAATVLLALNVLWQLHFPRSTLAHLGLQLGADVPVFVHGESAFAAGVGEQLTPMQVEPAWYLVLVPPVAVPTAGIFAAQELTRNTPRVKIADFPRGFGHNDLAPVVLSRYPQVQECLSWLQASAGNARMTGSGCCIFAAFNTKQQALEVQALVAEAWSSFVAQGRQQHPLRNL